MEINQLRYFLSICQSGNMMNAANNCGISQPALTKVIRSLEEELDVELFKRIGKTLVITPQGLALQKQAELILNQVQYIQKTMSELGGLKNSLTIAMMSAISGEIITKAIVDFINQHPGIKIEVIYLLLADLMEMLDAEKADVGIAALNRVRSDHFLTIPLYQSYMVYCMHPEHPLAHKPHVTYEDIYRYPLIIHAQSITRDNLLTRDMAAQGFAPEKLYKVQQISTAFNMLNKTFGFCIDKDIAKLQPGIVYSRLISPLSEMNIGLILPQKKRHYKDTMQFVNYMKKVYDHEKGKQS